MNDELMNKMLEEINNGIAWNKTIALDSDALIHLRMVIHNLLFERDIFKLRLGIAIKALIIADGLICVESEEDAEDYRRIQEALKKLEDEK